jgi:hypothetical protein
MKLYGVITTVKEYRGKKDVSFAWFCTDRGTPSHRRYADLIENYDPQDEVRMDEVQTSNRRMAEARIDELFTADEASQLKD